MAQQKPKTMNLLGNWKEEMRSAYLYREVSRCETGNVREALFRELASEAEKQAQIWAQKIVSEGGTAPDKYTPDMRSRLVAWLTHHLGPRMTRGFLRAMKVRGMSLYTAPDSRHFLPDNESGMEQRHAGLSGSGALRAAVFGVNDGLVSNLSLIMGVAGARDGDVKIVALTGIAGLLAGAFSMAAGEYVSMRSQREMYEYQIGLEADELRQYPDEEAGELALIYEARGIEREQARQMAKDLIADPERALDVMAREELGLNPEELGSPVGAAAASFVAFSLGAIIPLLPFLILPWKGALPGSIFLTGIALFAVGGFLSLYIGRGAIRGGLRMLLIGAGAGGATFIIGNFLNIALN